MNKIGAFGSLVAALVLSAATAAPVKQDIPNLASFRAVLPSYYPRWKEHVGTRAWTLLEQYTGRLG